MKMRLKHIGLFLYFIFTLFIMDNLLKILVFGKLHLIGTLYSLLFTITIALLLFAICTSFNPHVNSRLAVIFMFLLGFIYSSQLIYYKCFKTFYVLYSVANGSQVIEFWKDILFLIKGNFILILIFFIPAFFLFKFGKILFLYEHTHKSPLIALLFVIIFHSVSIAGLYMGGTKALSPIDLYFRGNYPTLSIEKFGLLTTMRLDIQKLVFGDSSDLFLFSPVLPEVKTVQANVKKTEEIVTYNTLKIDFDRFISTEKNKEIQNMHQYFKSVQPTDKNKYTGIYNGYNLIFLTAEAFSPYAVRADVTPTLYKMVNQGYHFTNFYNPLWGVSTSDGEYVACTGLLPKSGVWSFYESGKNEMPYAMGNQLKTLGYKTMAYHNHTYNYYKRNISHPNMGYSYKGVGNGLKIKKTWPESDLEMMKKTVDEYINEQPFHAYYMTVSGHLRYSFTGNNMAAKNKHLVEDLPYTNESKSYIATQIELDRALQYLFDRLEEKGVADKTLIVLSADHYPYGLAEKSINELAGHKVEKNFELYKSDLIVYTKGMKPTEVDKLCSSVDIIPTISNMLGLEYDSRLMIGKDIFSSVDPLVVFSNRSFITNKGQYNSETNKFNPKEGISVDKSYIEEISAKVEEAFYFSQKILENDYYSKVLGK